VSRARTSGSPRALYAKLRAAYPDAHCELLHDGPFQLLVATVLSARNTDAMVNQITPALFRRWPDAARLARAPLAQVEQALGRLGMFRQKSRHVVGLAQQLVAQHGGQVPADLDALVALPGVGRKTANVVLGVAFGAAAGVVVDTHVGRLAQRLGLTQARTPEKIELDLMALFPREQWEMLSHTLIFHGRRICTARRPACSVCPVQRDCPSAFETEAVPKAARTLPRATARRQSRRPTR
jgi:endonuclease III